MSGSGPLVVDYCGEIHDVDPSDGLTFGRDAELELDDNQYMHRVVGRFEARHDRWWLCNLGSRTAIEVYDRTTRSRATLMPHSDQALPGGDLVVRFSAGPTVYELEVRTKRVTMSIPDDIGPSDTLTLSDISFTETQLQLILTLAEGQLLAPQAPGKVPSSREAAQRLGWPITKFNRKLDNVCAKLSKIGVSGLRASGTDPAKDRRSRLVEYSIAAGLVNAEMLPLLTTGEH